MCGGAQLVKGQTAGKLRSQCRC